MFEVDILIYNKIKDTQNITDLFKYKFPVFKEMEDLKIINNFDEAKNYYIKNCNRINKNIGSTIYQNIFNQTEAHENLDNEKS